MIINKINLSFLMLFAFAQCSYASFIESTIGTAVVNDATATYYNPAALMLLKNPQFIAQDSIAYFKTHFSGQAIQSSTGFSQTGSSSSQTHYYLPSFYAALPFKDKVVVGLALIVNDFNRDIESNSILRYIQASNHIQDIDVVPAIGIKLNHLFSAGVGLNLSKADFELKPLSGLPSLSIPDSQSLNKSSGRSWGADVGILITPSSSTLIGLNYRSAITYKLAGQSILETSPPLVSNDYHFQYWTPARSVLSVNQFLNANWGLIGTVQYVQWNIFKAVHSYGVATRINSQAVILPSATANYHFHNAWLFTLGTHYRISTQWIIRCAGTFNQSPANGNYQISNGDSLILGASAGYKMNNTIQIDGSYAHAFIQDKKIDIHNNRNIIEGINKAFRNAYSLKLTINL